MANRPSTSDIWRGQSASVEQTLLLGRTIASHLRQGDVVALIGELGAGKTQLVRGLAQGMDIPDSAVASPTFVMVQEHAPRGGTVSGANIIGSPATAQKPVLVHIDAYRINSLDELDSIGWDGQHGDVLSDMRRGAVVAIEWADRLGDMLAADYLEVRLAHAAVELRDIEITGHGSWRSRLGELFDTLDEMKMNQMSGTATATDDEVKAAIIAGLPPTAIDAVIEAAAATRGKCPICKKLVKRDGAQFPFCSDRCRTIDLGKWISGDYVISRDVEQQDLDEE